MAKSSEKNKDKRQENLVMWKPGQSGNPSGRRLGTRNRKTVIMDAIKRLADANKMTPEELEELLHATGIQQAIKRGSFFHYKEIADGLYGKITDKMDVTSGGKTLADVLAAANGARRPKARGKASTADQG
jgi:hypothetical protein